MPSSNDSSLTDFAITLYRYNQAGLRKNRCHSTDHLDHPKGGVHHVFIRRTIGGDQYLLLLLNGPHLGDQLLAKLAQFKRTIIQWVLPDAQAPRLHLVLHQHFNGHVFNVETEVTRTRGLV